MIKTLTQSFVTLLLLANTIFAANVPNSGTILNTVKPPVEQEDKKALPPIPVQEYTAPIVGDDSIKVLVKKFEIEKNTVFSTEVLHGLIQEYEGKELSILDMKKVADIITKYYRAHGYFVARAYIPSQDLNDHIVRISIIEGVYGTVNINNTSNVKDTAIRRYFSKLDSQDVISMAQLERQLFLVNSLSGVQIVNAEIFPGKTVGSSDFTITAEKTRKFEGYVAIDNYGNRYTGKERASASGTINSPLGYGDTLNAYVLNSFSNELNYGHLSYTLPIGSFGMAVNIGASGVKYTLGDDYASLDAYGYATILEAGIAYPIIITSTGSLDIKGQYTHRSMSDWMVDENDKKSIDDFTLSLKAYKRMYLFTKNSSVYATVSFTQGHKSLDSQTAQINDAVLNSQGDFSKANLIVTHNLKLNEKATLVTLLNAQKSFNRNLDSSQELSVCGPYGVKAYNDNELSGDQGFLFSMELTHALPALKSIFHQAGIFYDTARVWQNTDIHVGLSDESRRVSDVGVSYAASYKNLNFKASYAYGFGSQADSVSQDSENRLFAQLYLAF